MDDESSGRSNAVDRGAREQYSIFQWTYVSVDRLVKEGTPWLAHVSDDHLDDHDQD